LREVKWVIITADNVEEQIKAIEESGRPVAFFALTDKGYENLGLNLSDLRAYIQQQQAIIAAYKAYYEKAEEALEGAVKEE
jgi:predicted transcriptional regulator